MANSSNGTTVRRASSEKDEGLGKRRVESIIRRLIRPAKATGCALGVFDSDGDLLEFVGFQLDRKSALAMLCALPLGASARPRTENLTSSLGTVRTLLCATADLSLNRRLVMLAMRPRTTERAWSRVAVDIEWAVDEIAEAIATETGQAAEDDRELLSFRSWHAGFFVLSQEFEVALEWHPHDSTSIELAELLPPVGGRLPYLLDRAVRRLTKSWDFSRPGTCTMRTAHPIPGLALRVVAMRGSEVLIGVFLEPFVGRQTVDYAASAFGISPRELDVLHALLDGHPVADIAVMLSLAESTVNDHIARLIVKTNSRNRIEMAAKLLGWPVVRSRKLPQGGTKGRAASGAAPKSA